MAETMITTVIPTFKRPTLLKRAIESVLSQSFKELKVCIYDNASGDETEAIVKDFAERDSRVFYYKNSENIGAMANISQGFNAVTTPYYSLLSDDDFLLPGFYEQAIKAFDTHPSAGFVCSKTIWIDLINRKIQYRNQDWSAGFHEPSNEIVSKMFASDFTSTGVLLSKKLSQTIGIFEPSGSDILYLTIASASVPFVTMDHYGAVLMIHEEAYSAIGQGPVKESVSLLYKHFLASMNNVMDLTLAPEQKVHLLMYVTKAYKAIFDAKKAIHLVNNNEDEDGLENIMLLPSLASDQQLLRYYHLVPKKIVPLMPVLFKPSRWVKRLLINTFKSDWVTLPKEAHSLLETHHSDVSKLMPYLSK
jgi:GT2 family glycosyltransferase